MAAPTVDVTVHVDKPDGSPLSGAKVYFKLQNSEVAVGLGYIVSTSVSGTTDVNGDTVVAVWPNALGSTESMYEVTISSATERNVLSVIATVPNVNCNLWDVANLPVYPGKSDSQFAADSASASAADAAVSAASAAADLVATNQDTIDTAADLVATNQDTIDTAADLVATNADVILCQTAYDNFDDRWLGDKAADPTLDNDGNALLNGAAYFNTVVSLLRLYDGTIWNDVGASSASVFEFTATAAQTTFTGLDVNGKTLSYKAGYLQVSKNGWILPSADYTATNGTSVVLNSGASLDDDIVIFSFGALNTTDTYTKAEVDNAINAINSVEIGSVAVIPDTVIPTGYLECNGASLDTTTYADLFAVLGYKYGGAAASFSIPDYRGEFLRGFDNTKGSDPDAAGRTDRGDGTTGDNVGTKQGHELNSHDHDALSHAQNGTSGGRFRNDAGAINPQTLSTQLFGGNETRPRNVNVMYCIKY